MKKKLQLRLIESNDMPQLGNIIKAIDGSYFIDGRDYGFMSGDKVIKPIAISDEEIKVGDKGLDLESNQIFTCIEVGKGSIYGYFNLGNSEDDAYDEYKELSKKIELLPEHFSNDILQLIVDGVLVDGSEIEVEYDEVDKFLVLDSKNKAIISIPKSNIMYSEEEVRTLIIEAIESFNDDVDEEVIISWFNHNKKK